MPRRRKTQEEVQPINQDLPDIYRPIDPEAREQQMISFAVDLAERKLRDGTATSQIIEHYLRLGSQRAKLEMALMQEDLELKHAKTEEITSRRTENDKYNAAIEAMKLYSGNASPEEYYD